MIVMKLWSSLFVLGGLIAAGTGDCGGQSKTENAALDPQPASEVRALVEEGCEFAAVSRSLFYALWHPGNENRFCGFFVHEGVRVERFFGSGPHGRYRIVYLKLSSQTVERLIIFVAGGPREVSTGFGRRPFNSDAVVGLARQPGAGVVVPDYLGTAFRSLYPASDVEAAADEILDLVRRLRVAHPRREVVVAAASAGSLVALEVLRHEQVPVTISFPAFNSFKDAVERPQLAGFPADVATRISRFYRYNEQRTGVELVTTTFGDQLRAFAGVLYNADLRELVARIPPAHRSCLAVIYGTKDARTHVWRAAEFQLHHPSVPVTALDGMGHGPATEAEAALWGKTVQEATPRCRR